MEDLLSRYKTVQTRIAETCRREGRDPHSVKLIAVSKTKPFSLIEELYRIGHRDFGENYAQELVAKAEEARLRGLSEIRWHFIGHLQTNKVKLLLPHVERIHAIDSEKLLYEIEKRGEAIGKKVRGLVEVNLDQEASKAGISPSELRPLLTSATSLSHIVLDGLMAIPDPRREGGPRDAFARLAALARTHSLPQLSMGMTSDFEDAIAEGSGFVRVGTAIFGERT